MRFGIAVRDITPPFKTPMYGYGCRRDVFDCVNDPMTLTALLLEEGGRRALIVAADLGMAPEGEASRRLMAKLGSVAGCPAENVILNASHTHGAAATPMSEPIFDEITKPPSCRQFEDLLCRLAEEAAAEAVSRLAPGRMEIAEGRTGFPMNRRPTINGKVPNAPNPSGPREDRMRLLVVRDKDGGLAGVGMILACHPVSTGAQHRITADYPGAWREEFRRAFGPKVTPFFLQGAGADTRPRHAAEDDHWRAVPHAELPGMGQELLAETLAVLTKPAAARQLGPLSLRGAVVEAVAPCERLYARREDIAPLLSHPEYYIRNYAELCKRIFDAGKALSDTVTFHVQTLWLDSGLALI
ncbi:MAG TPA: hypothetical protein P5137_10095, partial [Candidatus Brocadiia bacterium]|nr:hypothetical protein [Candidatus Brocadiia bacterium]